MTYYLSDVKSVKYKVDIFLLMVQMKWHYVIVYLQLFPPNKITGLLACCGNAACDILIETINKENQSSGSIRAGFKEETQTFHWRSLGK